MAARVALLLAFTGFFAVAWESDRQPGTVLSVAKARWPEPLPVAEATDRLAIISQITGSVANSSESDFSRCVLPNEIRPGTYRVVDDRGSVGWTTIPEAGDLRNDPLPNDAVTQKPVDVFVSQSSEGRWYFIRVNAALILATPQKDHAVLQ